MNKDELKNIIVQEFRLKPIMQNVGEDQDFFNAGVSSLTIVELQIKIEDKLELNVPTADLMRLSTMQSWVDIYWQYHSEQRIE